MDRYHIVNTYALVWEDNVTRQSTPLLASRLHFRVFNKNTNEEFFFKNACPTKQPLEFVVGAAIPLYAFYIGEVDYHSGISFNLNYELLRESEYDVTVNVIDHILWEKKPIGLQRFPRRISRREFINKVRDEYAPLNTPINRPIQTIYQTVEHITHIENKVNEFTNLC